MAGSSTVGSSTVVWRGPLLSGCLVVVWRGVYCGLAGSSTVVWRGVLSWSGGVLYCGVDGAMAENFRGSVEDRF